MAKDLVRTRHQIEKFYKLKSQLQGVSLRIQVRPTSVFFPLIHINGIFFAIHTRLLHSCMDGVFFVFFFLFSFNDLQVSCI